MYDTCTVCESYVVITSYKVCFLCRVYKVEQRLILFVFQIFTGIGFQYFKSRNLRFFFVQIFTEGKRRRSVWGMNLAACMRTRKSGMDANCRQ